MIGIVAASTALWMPSLLRGQEPATPVDPVVAELLEGHNQERAKAGLGPLKLEPKLMEAARAHAKDMAERVEMTHEGSDGSTPQQRVVGAGYHYLLTGENVARGYRAIPEVMQSWMESPPHKKNILGDFTEIGLAKALDKEGKPYWCADFGKPMPKFDPSTAASDLLKQLNTERATAKLNALTIEPKLAKHAQEQATMLARKKGQPGVTATLDGIDEKLYRELALSTATGHPTAEVLVQKFMEKPDLKSQILGKFSKVGIGYANAEDGVPFWVIVLGQPAGRR